MNFWVGFEKRAQERTLKELDQDHQDQIPGGIADKKKPSDYPKRELQMGVDVEMEHTKDPKKALEIAMDHLEEDLEYYTKLNKIHKG